MSFQWPLVLLGLLIIPVLAAVYLLMQRRRTKYAVRFTNVDLLANVVAKTPSWRRHVPAVLLLLSTALLIFALARPRVEASTTREQGAIMLATDTSGSMTATDVKPDRMTAARNAAKQFVGKIPKQVRLGLVTFDQAARLLVNPTRTGLRSTTRWTRYRRRAARRWATRSACRSRRCRARSGPGG